MKISKIVTAIGVVAATSASAQESSQTYDILSPMKTQVEGVAYSRAIELLRQERHIEYGEPIQINIDKKEGIVDLSDFDGVTVSVTLEQALSQPNRTEPSL